MLNKDINSDVLIRWCSKSEIGWVNEQYENVGFKPSQLNSDRIAIAIYCQERIGLGRLCQIEDSAFELGGIYVHPDYRELGIARKLVRFMLENCNPKDRVYCLPFAHLRNFYLSEGFEQVPEELLSTVPKDIVEKYHWCNETYPHEVLLLQHRTQY